MKHETKKNSKSYCLWDFFCIFADGNLNTMKLKKRKIKFATIFFICWFALLVFLVDGVLKFQTLVDYFGSYALVEVALLLIVLLPTLAVYRLTKEHKNKE